MDAKEFIKNAALYRPLMMRIAMSILHNNMDSEDAVQDTLFRCWLHLDSLRDIRRIRPWLIRSLTNRCLDKLQKAKRERSLFEVLTEHSEISIEYDPFIPLEIRELMQEVSYDERACLYLHYWDGYTISEIAGLMSVSCSTIKSRMRRGRKKLSVRYQ